MNQLCPYGVADLPRPHAVLRVGHCPPRPRPGGDGSVEHGVGIGHGELELHGGAAEVLGAADVLRLVLLGHADAGPAHDKVAVADGAVRHDHGVAVEHGGEDVLVPLDRLPGVGAAEVGDDGGGHGSSCGGGRGGGNAERLGESPAELRCERRVGGERSHRLAEGVERISHRRRPFRRSARCRSRCTPAGTPIGPARVAPRRRALCGRGQRRPRERTARRGSAA